MTVLFIIYEIVFPEKASNLHRATLYLSIIPIYFLLTPCDKTIYRYSWTDKFVIAEGLIK